MMLSTGRTIFDYAKTSEKMFLDVKPHSRLGKDDPVEIMAACIALSLGAMWAHYIEETGDMTLTNFQTTNGDILSSAFVFASATDEEWVPSPEWPYSKQVMRDFLLDVAGDALEVLANRAAEVSP